MVDFVLATLLKLMQLYSYALLIYIFMSWAPNLYNSAFGQFLIKICEPFLAPFQKVIPRIAGIDFSPLLAFFVLNLASKGLVAVFDLFN